MLVSNAWPLYIKIRLEFRSCVIIVMHLFPDLLLKWNYCFLESNEIFKKYLGRSFSSSKSVKRKSYTKRNIWLNTELSKLSNLWNVWAVWSETRNKWNKRSKSRWRVSTKELYPYQIFGDATPLFGDTKFLKIFELHNLIWG